MPDATEQANVRVAEQNFKDLSPQRNINLGHNPCVKIPSLELTKTSSSSWLQKLENKTTKLSEGPQAQFPLTRVTLPPPTACCDKRHPPREGDGNKRQILP